MKKRFIFPLLAACLTALLLAACIPAENPGEEESTVNNTVPAAPDGYAVVPLRYPESAVQTLAERGISLSSLCGRAAGETSYSGNRHYTGTNLVVSPYFTASVDDVAVPVYAAPVYVATGSYGALHSFASVDVDFGDHTSVLLKLTVDNSVPVTSAQVFSNEEAQLACSQQGVRLTVRTHGVYTIVLNDSQDYAFTLFVRTYQDEDAEIAAYRAQYGEDHVKVMEPGVHEIDYLLMTQDHSVLYLKAGAILLPKHTMDVMDDTAAASAAEFGAKETNGLGLNRYPVINGYRREDITIAGRGTVDMTQLDWHERRGIVFSLCSTVSVDGVILVNPCEWALITYRCEDVSVTQSAVLGYRTNSDAFAICNSVDVTVTDCFARTGDDMFEVKTLGGEETAVSRNITFRRCQAWGSKARCFGVIGEMERDISNILFEDGIVIFRDAVWDNNRIGSLVVLRECGSGVVDSVTFRNITIHEDAGRAINVGVYSADLTDSRMTNIVFENIQYHAQMKSQIRMNRGSTLSVLLRNVAADDVPLTRSNLEEYFYWDQPGLILVE